MTLTRPPCDLIVIGASAGGVEALLGLFRTLPSDLQAAMLVVLHIGEGGYSNLASILARVSPLPIANAFDGQVLEPGHVAIAVADHQLTVEPNGVIRVLRSPKVDNFRPSIDALFKSAASAYGPRVAGVILSGMLKDGTSGLVHVTAAGGVSIVQDPDEAAHSGMPENAIIGDHVQYRLPVRAIGPLLADLARHPAPGR